METKHGEGNSKERERVKSAIIIALILLGIMWLLVIWRTFGRSPLIKDGHIQREYSQLLKHLDEEPENIEAQPYKAHIPDIIQEDIQRMLSSDEELDIVYYDANNLSQINIVKDSKTPLGIRIEVGGKWEYREIINEISFYRKGDNIIIYGISYGWSREAIRIAILPEEEKPVSVDYLDKSIDLFGTILMPDKNFYSKKMTLVEIGRKFQFYKLGKQIEPKQGESTFPGGEILEINNSYILDDKHDLYYMYYNTCEDNPWVHFVKVAENVSEVWDIYSGRCILTESDEYYESICYPIFKKDNCYYVGVDDRETQYTYGANYQDSDYAENQQPMEEINFDVDVIKLSKENIKEIEIYREGIVRSDWYVKIFYNAPCKVYEQKRINGLDANIIENIPENKLAKFDGKKVTADELDEVIEDLKKLYQKYEGNEF